MITLRAKLTALFVGTIVVVVALTTLLAFKVLDHPRADPLLETIHLALRVAGKAEALRRLEAAGITLDDRSMGFQATPATGRIMEGPTHQLRDTLAFHNVPFDAVVSEFETDGIWVISLKVAENEWLVLPADTPSPGSLLPVFGGWLLLVAAGTTGITVAAVYRMTQPLALVQRTVARIGPSGEAPLLVEAGPPEVRAMAHAINTLSIRLKSAMESRMRLVAAAGHDLRTPMTRMRLRAEFLPNGDREKWIADIDELDHIADSAICLVHEETEAVPPNAIRLDETVSEVISELQELHFDARLEDRQAVCVCARPLSLKRALRNLIINAATHGNGAVVSVSIEDALAVVSIEDRGPGIPEALLQRAFEPFFRVDQARKPSVPGAGLGLAIAKEIIQRNMGHVDLSNRSGGGLRQRVKLPVMTLAQ